MLTINYLSHKINRQIKGKERKKKCSLFNMPNELRTVQHLGAQDFVS